MSGELFPEIVARLQSIGIKHEWRQAEHDIKVACPVCHEGVMLIAESKPWHYCPHPTCESWLWSFSDILTALAEETKKP